MKADQLKKMIKEELSVKLTEAQMLNEIADIFTVAGGTIIGLAVVGILKRIGNIAKVATTIGLENLQDFLQRKADKQQIIALKDTVNSVAAKFKDDQQLQLILQELEKYPHQEGKANRERIAVIKKLKQYVESKLTPEETENLEDIVATLRGKKKWGDENLEEGQEKKRYVATIEFYVYGENENYANQEVQQIMNMIDERYDNHPSVVDLKPQQFGKIGMGEASRHRLTPKGDAGVMGENKVDAFVTEMIKVFKEMRDSAENIEDFIDSSMADRSNAQLLKIIKNPKLKDVVIKYMELDKKLNSLSPENQLLIAKKFAERYYEMYEL